MERICGTFDRLRRSHRRALIPFIMGGDPSLSLTGELVLALEDAGADLIEIGIPFSDPLADGPTIQRASARALASGATPAAVLEAVAAVRRRVQVPLVCLSYWNPIVQFGASRGAADSARFVRAAHASGLSGVIVPDLSIEEGGRFRAAAAREGFAVICLAAPTSPPGRLRMIARASTGFIYYVSLTGTTGARQRLPSDLVQGVRQLKLVTTKPVCVGFGISTPAQAAAVARVADGVIVGSALIQAMERVRRSAGAVRAAVRFVRRLRAAV